MEICVKTYLFFYKIKVILRCIIYDIPIATKGISMRKLMMLYYVFDEIKDILLSKK